MGGVQSTEAVTVSTKQHNEIETLEAQIQSKGDAMIKTIINVSRNYLNVNFTEPTQLCSKLDYHYVDVLKSHFPIQRYENNRIQLGITLDRSLNPEGKMAICNEISNFYKTKINLIHNIQERTKECTVIEGTTYDNLVARLRAADVATNTWELAYKRVQEFNKNIKSRYIKMLRLLDEIKQTQSWDVLDKVGFEVNDLNSTTVGVCEIYGREIVRLGLSDA